MKRPHRCRCADVNADNDSGNKGGREFKLYSKPIKFFPVKGCDTLLINFLPPNLFCSIQIQTAIYRFKISVESQAFYVILLYTFLFVLQGHV